MKNISFFKLGGGVLEGPYVESRVTKISRPHHRADKYIANERNNCQFFIYGPQCENFAFWAIRGGLGGQWVAHK